MFLNEQFGKKKNVKMKIFSGYLKIYLSFIVPILFLVACNQSRNELSIYADKVNIYRDVYGVPHVYGKDDAAAAFGFAYAQAEDNFFIIEDNYIDAIGRSTEVVGKEGLLDDWLNRSLEVTKYSRMEFDSLSTEVKAICIGYSEGLNYYLKTHPEIKPKLLNHFEPWYVLAFIRYLYYQRVLLLYYSNIPKESFQEAYEKLNHLNISDLGSLYFNNKKITGEGSNTWAVNGEKSTSGNSLLFINPHLSFFGNAQVYEAHIMSETGWNFTGYTRFGFPFPYVGFGEKIGWSSTDNNADLVDAYIEDFVEFPADLSYHYNGDIIPAKSWIEQIKIREGDTILTQELSFIKTHHGPIVSIQNNDYLSIKMAKYEDAGWLDQWYWMTKAQNLAEFKAAASRLDVLFGNYTYADVEGNIMYVYNAAIPIRSEKYDWTQPVDGSITDTEWKGYHTFDELPQVMNPASGWIQNCNNTPFLTTLNDNPKPNNFPSYMVVEKDNNRSKQSRRILNQTLSFTYESFVEKSYTTYLLSAEKELSELFGSWDSSADSRLETEALAEAIGLLHDWDKISTISSIPTTLYIYWSNARYRLGFEKPVDKDINLIALQEALDELTNSWDTWKVPWGDINRLQRFVDKGDNKLLFNDSLPSLPVAGAPSWTGSIFTFGTNSQSKTKKRYGVRGNSYVSIIEFGSKIKAGSLHYFGSSGNPSSPHYFDQAEIYTKGKYKKALLTFEEVKENSVKTYRPGEKQ